ncbi:hypothetical protein [Staphylococcus warneri]|uniref:hypothetical protein n=1 Tax=Staphylococcus warneri TaxID=1292 RepID=UPI0018ED0009|nr:hypothetical protein [Staphylococcus warneri]
MKRYYIEIYYTGVIEDTVLADDEEKAEFEAQDIAMMELPGNIDEYTISIQEDNDND